MSKNSLVEGAVYLFEELPPFLPSPLLCIIDRLHSSHSNDGADAAALRAMVRPLFTREAHGKVKKTLFTTDGFVPVLELLRGDSRIDALDFEQDKKVGSATDRENLVLLRTF